MENEVSKFIIVKNARENNLQNLSVKIPKNKLVVMTGISGSGKSSLAFKTIYEEGSRRYMDSLSSYARQFLGNAQKPDVDAIDGLSPAIAIEQKTTHNNPRSTVGTITEIHDYLRLLFARIGRPFCPRHKIEITAQKLKDIVDSVYRYQENDRLIISAPLVKNSKGSHAKLLQKLDKEGFIRVKVDGQILRLDSKIDLSKNHRHSIDIIIDRILISDANRSRIHDGIEVALHHAKGFVTIENVTQGESQTFSISHSCDKGDFEMPKIEPRLFSFNAPVGMCNECKGIGVKRSADIDLIIPLKRLALQDGAIKILENHIGTTSLLWQKFTILFKHYEIPMDVPIDRLPEEDLDIIMNGSDEEIEFTLTGPSGNVYRKHQFIEGIGQYVERMYLDTSSEFVRKIFKRYLSDVTCPRCKGKRLNDYALAVKINKINIAEFSKFSLSDALDFINNLKLNKEETDISFLIRKELNDRLGFLNNVGLDYLTLNRKAETLSGGEAQRIRLATQIGSNLTGVLYVLDEPSIGLHQKDNAKLIDSLKKMRDLGNTLIVVEHDEETILESDWVIDIGKFAGKKGGNLIAEGTPEQIANNTNSITGDYLSGRRKISVPKSRRSGNGKVLTFLNASENNLQNLDVKIPLGKFIVVTGVSGSGKSTLVNEVIHKSLVHEISNPHIRPGRVRKVKGMNWIEKVIRVSQSPIGRTPRSNPATYTSVFEDIRRVFANTMEAKARGYTISRFSFNVKEGRCDKCQGDGSIKIEMHFLPDVYVMCNHCNGQRYNYETLEVKFKNKSIADVLSMQVEEALKLFENNPKIRKKLQTLSDVGLGYIHLGQSAVTLSGGEAQRVKLALHLQKSSNGRSLYVLDEPTTGLHSYDVERLLTVINRIVDRGDTVVVIEHNLDVIKQADYIIDLGPDGGFRGGQIVAQGTPEQVAKSSKSYTAQYLKSILGE